MRRDRLSQDRPAFIRARQLALHVRTRVLPLIAPGIIGAYFKEIRGSGRFDTKKLRLGNGRGRYGRFSSGGDYPDLIRLRRARGRINGKEA
jgi:hypothetical protein